MALKEFKLPDIGEGIAEGEIVSWKVAAGQAVKEEDEFVEVMTDKATVTLTVPFTGKIAGLKCAEGDVVPVGSVIAVIDAGAAGGDAPAAAPAAAPMFVPLAIFLSGLYAMNLLLLVLNLVPVPPLDGSAVIGLLLSQENARRLQVAVHGSSLSIIGLILAVVAIRELVWPGCLVSLRVLVAGG